MTSAELAQVEGVALDDDGRRAVVAYWDAVIGECEAAVSDGPVPSARLRSADERRAVRREARRERVAAVRSLRLHGVALLGEDTNGDISEGIDQGFDDVMGAAA